MGLIKTKISVILGVFCESKCGRIKVFHLKCKTNSRPEPDKGIVNGQPQAHHMLPLTELVRLS
jgi:hypothetical protein